MKILIGISLILRIWFICSTNLLVEEAYYWNYANHLDMGYLDHPPLVALLIKLSTLVFGTSEWGVRACSLFSWCLLAWINYRWTRLIRPSAAPYTVLFLSILPFFFIHSLIITPDQPLMVCWSFLLYCLYRALVLEESGYWYGAGVALGLGMLSKYSIVLLGPATLLYLLLVPSLRKVLLQKEPYLALLIALLLFTPVLYWNATHEWVSFYFQGSRRFQGKLYFSLHHIIGLMLLFLLPLGVQGLWQLVSRKTVITTQIPWKTLLFFRVYTLVPLVFFALFSLAREVKFNWIGPSFLALLPWLAILSDTSLRVKNCWLRSSWAILVCYALLVIAIGNNTGSIVERTLFKKSIHWEDLVQSLRQVAQDIEEKEGKEIVFVPLDSYNIGSELAFYQAKTPSLLPVFPVVGRHIFGLESLMYKYWSSEQGLEKKILLLVGENPWDFQQGTMAATLAIHSPITPLWAHSQGSAALIKPYYYQIATLGLSSP